MKVLFFIAVIICLCQSLGCVDRHQCFPAVSNGRNWVDCIVGQCTCLSLKGFDGNATFTNPCDCSSPKETTHHESGQLLCVDIEGAVVAANQKIREAFLKSQVVQIYQNTIGITTPTLIAAEYISVDNLFASRINGRVTPFGSMNDTTFRNFFYSLAAFSNITNVRFIDLKAEGNTVSIRVDTEANEAGEPIFNLTQTGFFYFDPNNKVAAADLSLLNFGKHQNIPPQFAIFVAQGVCEIHSILCTGPNQQYANVTECINFLINSIPFGTYDQINSNTLVCRSIFADMVPYPPAIHGSNLHCPDIGPSGGVQCRDVPYSDFYRRDVVNPFPQ